MAGRRRTRRRGGLAAQSRAGALGFAVALVGPRLARAALDRLNASGGPPAGAPRAAIEPPRWRPVPAAELRARLPAEPEAPPSERAEAVLAQLESVAADLDHVAADERGLQDLEDLRLLEAAFGDPEPKRATEPGRKRAETPTATDSREGRRPVAGEHLRAAARAQPARSPRRVLALCAAFALPAAAAAAIAWTYLPGDSADATGQPAATLADAADRPAEARPHPSGRRTIVIRHARAKGRRAAHRARRRRSRPGRPVALSIPAAGVQARVKPVRQRAKGIEIPPPGRAGWFAAGPRPGEVGRTVIVGHLDGRRGPGLFARLPRLDEGRLVSVRSAGGKRRRYRVVGKTVVRKSRFPARAVYGRSRRSVLVLVTCGGPWSEAHGYRDNVIVYARAL